MNATTRSMYEQAQMLCEQVKTLKVKTQLAVVLVSYSRDVAKVRVDFLSMGASSLQIEYWGNAEFEWVKKNITANAKSVREA